MGFLIFFLLPGMLIFDYIPKLFGKKGLTDWYIEKYQTKNDDIILIFYVIIFIILVFIYWYIKIQTSYLI